MNYNNKFSKHLCIYLYISKNKQKYLCGAAAAAGGGRPYDYIVWQAANASREPCVYLFIYCISKAKGNWIFFFLSLVFYLI